jgi:DNA-binding NarL/FixJ family response regulator
VERIREVMQETPEPSRTQPVDLAQFDPSGQADARPFTARERQILRSVFSGKSNKEIAHEMTISESLVKAVLQQLFAKTGVRSRSQLVRTAIERHWKELEEETEGL